MPEPESAPSNGFRALLARRTPAFGSWVKLPTVETIELLHLAGFDFVVIDLEHSPIGPETMSAMLAVAKAYGSTTLVRLPDHSPSSVQRCLDLGAAGVIAPHVDSAGAARDVAAAAHFEPRGTRGVGPTSRAGSWGMRSLRDYLHQGDEAVVLGQIESEAGVLAAHAMVRERSFDGLLVGPADLSVSLGVDIDSPTVDRHARSTLEVCKAAGVPCGIAVGGDPGRARELGRAGFDFVVVSNDASILGSGAARLVAEFRDSP